MKPELLNTFTISDERVWGLHYYTKGSDGVVWIKSIIKTTAVSVPLPSSEPFMLSRKADSNHVMIAPTSAVASECPRSFVNTRRNWNQAWKITIWAAPSKSHSSLSAAMVPVKQKVGCAWGQSWRKLLAQTPWWEPFNGGRQFEQLIILSTGNTKFSNKGGTLPACEI